MAEGRDPAAYRPCVGVVLLGPGGKVFAGQRRGMPGAWQMPQGGIDPGESPREAALRELEEETSVPASAVAVEAESPGWIYYDLPDEAAKGRWGGRFVGQRQRWFLMRLTGSEAAIDLATDHPEFDAWRWMTPAELLAAIIPFKRAAYAAVFDAFEGRI